MNEEIFIISDNMYYRGALKGIKKSDRPFQPLFEAITNSIESFLETPVESEPFILLQFHYLSTIVEGYNEFNFLEIKDNGAGFTNESFNRFRKFKDDRKGFNNRGSGRIQFVHFFSETTYTSKYLENNNLMERKFSISKSDSYMEKNALIKLLQNPTQITGEVSTTLKCKNLLDENDKKYYNSITVEDVKREILFHYIEKFCSLKENLPSIKIEFFRDGILSSSDTIEQKDIPDYDSQFNISANYYMPSQDLKRLQRLDDTEVFKIKAFKLEQSTLRSNAIKVTSKNEIVDKIKMNFNHLKDKDVIDGYRYLFLLSSDYLNTKDSDTRGNINIPRNESEYLKELKRNGQGPLFLPKEILLEDIEEHANSKIEERYAEIRSKSEEQKSKIDKLKEMFLLNEETIKRSNIRLSDSPDKILEKVYINDAKQIAKGDALIKKHIDSLQNLDPSSDEYDSSLDRLANELVKEIPFQNRVALSQYIARRKLVLSLFDKILGRKLDVQKKASRNIDEKLLHNLFFHQGSTEPTNSDLWIIQEDFIYFNGISESMLGNLEINEEKILKTSLTSEEEKYRYSLGEDRYLKRTDVLLFPAESKCVIIEFKNPEVNVGQHLNQINRYASLIRNLTKDKFNFNTFYGYLIGEKIDSDDVRDFDSSFQIAHNLDYLFRPSKPIVGKFGRADGYIYTEVIKYSTLLERARKRNEIFIKKLIGDSPTS